VPTVGVEVDSCGTKASSYLLRGGMAVRRGGAGEVEEVGRTGNRRQGGWERAEEEGCRRQGRRRLWDKDELANFFTSRCPHDLILG
jgi:hypothetical protein